MDEWIKSDHKYIWFQYCCFELPIHHHGCHEYELSWVNINNNKKYFLSISILIISEEGSCDTQD